MPVLAVHRTIVAVDVEGFGDRCRINPHQVAVREGLYRAVRQAFHAATIPWAECHREDRGDASLSWSHPRSPGACSSSPWLPSSSRGSVSTTAPEPRRSRSGCASRCTPSHPRPMRRPRRRGGKPDSAMADEEATELRWREVRGRTPRAIGAPSHPDATRDDHQPACQRSTQSDARTPLCRIVCESRRESHLRALADPGVNLSAHRDPVITGSPNAYLNFGRR